MLGILLAQLYFDHYFQRLACVVQAPREFGRIHGLNSIEHHRRPPGFVRLQVADQVKPCAIEQGDIGVFRLKFLHVILAEIPDAERPRRVDRLGGEYFGDRDQRNFRATPPGAVARPLNFLFNQCKVFPQHALFIIVPVTGVNLDTAATLASIEAFLRSCRDPGLIEPGEEVLPLIEGSYAVGQASGRLTIEAWDDTRNIARRVTAIASQSPARLELHVERFGKRSGTLLLIDRARGSNQSLQSRASRTVFREQFRLFLRRQFPQWRIGGVTTSADLEHSLSPAYPRALLKKGTTGMAAIAAPPGASVDGVLGFGLVWLDYLRRRESKVLIEGLAMFLPEGMEMVTCLRLRCLNPRATRISAFVYDADHWERQIDPVLHGNIDTQLEPASRYALARGTAFTPEAMLEARLRAQLPRLDARLMPSPVYGQVPAFAGGDRGVLDLLAVEHSGRLAVLELKASTDLQLPMQALDYWVRVRWHNDRGDFQRHGFFPNVRLRSDPPRLLLVAPALEFHSTSEALLRYYSPEIEVDRVGLAVKWQREIAVMFRFQGAQPAR